MSEWQPIETAPKDGKPVDLLAKRWRAQFDDFEYCRFVNRSWQNEGIGWVSISDGGISYDPKSADALRGWRLTHWMPLPPPPQDAT